MPSRTPARDTYDAVVDLLPWDGAPRTAIAFVKFTYTFDDAGVRHAPPTPLVGDLRDPAVRRQLPPDSDFAPFKAATDVVVLGSAYPRAGAAETQRDVEVRAGSTLKRLRVFGQRLVRGHLGGGPRVERMEPLGVVPLTRAEAYGGRRPPTPIEARRPPLLASLMLGASDPSALYPRNPDGKGYWHPAWAGETLALPRVEDPSDPLTLERLMRQPERPWYEAPLPWHLDWMGLDQFPRLPLIAPQHRPRSEELAEVARGLWPADALDVGSRSFLERSVILRAAPLGLAWPDPEPGAPVELVGMHPERDLLRFALPAPPHLAFEVEGTRREVAPRLNALVIYPDTRTFSMTWVGALHDLPRGFIPGVHAHIPLHISVDGDTPLAYATPPPTLTGAPHRDSVSAHPWASRPAPNERTRDQVPHAESIRVGHVDPARGRVLLRELDFEITTHVPLRIERSYSSTMFWRRGALGPGWSHALEQAIWTEGEWLLHRLGDGTELAFPLRGGALGLGARVHHAAAGVSVRRLSQDRYGVEHADGRRFDFTVLDPTADRSTAKLATIYGPDGAALEVRYNSASTLDRVLLPGGGNIRFEHDADGHLIRVTGPANDGRDQILLAAYEYDAEGQLRRSLDASGRATIYRYASGRLTEREVDGEAPRAFEYAEVGSEVRCVKERWGDETRTYRFDPERRRFSVRTATNAPLAGYLTPGLAVSATRDPLANDLERAFDEATGLLISQTSPDGETTFLYDSDDHLADVTTPGGGTVALEHDARAHPTRRRGPDGLEWAAYWDALGRLVGVERGGASTLYEHDAERALAAVLTPSEARIALEREPSSQALVGVRGPLGERRARLDAMGRIAEVQDELGHTHGFLYDARGRVKEHRLPGGVRRSFTSDVHGNVTSTGDAASATKLERDPDGNLTHVDQGGGEGPRLHRDAEGRVTVVESESFDYWELSRNGAGHVTAQSAFGGEECFTRRDHAGRTTRSMRGRVRTTVGRDAAGRPTALEHSDGSFQRFEWSLGGRLTHAQEADRRLQLGWHRGRLRSERSEPCELTSTYSTLGHRVALEDSLGLTLRVERDALGHAVRLNAQRGAQAFEVTFERDALGRERRRRLPGGLEVDTARDALGRATRRSLRSEGTERSSLEFTYAGLERLVRIADSRRGTRTCSHDARGRLVRVGELVRALDPVGRVFRSADLDDHTYEGIRLVEAYGDRFDYDDAGRRVRRTSVLDQVTRYSWDTLGRLIVVHLSDTDRIAYDYDALGRMVRRRRERRVLIAGIEEPVWECDDETEFVWDGLSILHERRGERVTTWIREAGQLVAKLSDEGAWAIVTDPLGVPTELIDAKGETRWLGTVDVFGALTLDIEGTTCPWRHAGHWQDPDTGLQHTWARVYDPATGAYLSPSPLGVGGGSNVYGYLPDPLSETSPLGLGPGYATFGGELRIPTLECELLERFIACLDRGDGAAGPRSRFAPDSARWRLPDPSAILWGAWDAFRPARNTPTPSTSYTALPPYSGLSGR